MTMLPTYVGQTVTTGDPTRNVCRMKGCDAPRVKHPDYQGFCAEHIMRLDGDLRFCPVEVIPVGDEGVTATLCGLCGLQVWCLRRVDDPGHAIGNLPTWTIETTSRPDGRVWIRDGGFRVVTTDAQRDWLIADGVPLFRSHTPCCPHRKTHHAD